MTKNQVRDYYASFGENEWSRLDWPEGQLEAAITGDALTRHLKPGSMVLDIGGGPGRWSVWLAQHGHRVVLADLSPTMLDIARIKVAEHQVADRVTDIIEADACDLSRFSEGQFDAVLCLGPFYHLTEASARDKAAREVARMLKPGGKCFVAFMPVFGFIRRTLALRDEQHHLADRVFMERLMNEGVFVNEIPGRFNSGYGVKPDAIRPFLEKHGLLQLELLSDSGFLGSQSQQIAELATRDPEAHKRVLQLLIDTAGDPSNLGASVHLLYIGQRA